MEGKNVVVLGAAESGVGAALLAKKHGYHVFVSDKGTIQPAYMQALAAAGIDFEQGKHDEARILNASLIIKSPGIPEKAPLIQAIRAKGIALVSEIEFASWFTNATIIAITGTNGKTTTTLLTHHLLVHAGLDAALGGNVGKSFAANVLDREYPIHVLELSSFQLDDIQRFHPHISMLLNITPDHLDRYNYQMEGYARAKFRIMENQRETDLFLYNGSDQGIMQWLPGLELHCTSQAITTEMIQSDGLLHVKGHVFDMKQTSLQGTHNAMNALFAIHAALEMGVSPEQIQLGLNSYINAPHRMESVGEVDGVRYINDSKATNVEAAFYALQAMTAPFVWVVGGQDKGNDYTSLLELIQSKARGIVCLGIDNAKIKTAFGALGLPMEEVRSAAEAVRIAAGMAQAGDVVLLSPACASFDLFKNYEDRGNQFREAVQKLLNQKGTH